VVRGSARGDIQAQDLAYVQESDLECMGLNPIQMRKMIQISISVKNVSDAPAAIVQYVCLARAAQKDSKKVRKSKN
jgi:hypothetical protein